MIKILFSDAVNIVSPYQRSQFSSSSSHLKNSCFIFALSSCPYPASMGCQMSVALAKQYHNMPPICHHKRIQHPWIREFFVPLGYHKKSGGFLKLQAWVLLSDSLCIKTPVSPSIRLKVYIYMRVPRFFFSRWYLFSFASEDNGNPWLCSVWTKTNVQWTKTFTSVRCGLIYRYLLILFRNVERLFTLYWERQGELVNTYSLMRFIITPFLLIARFFCPSAH